MNRIYMVQRHDDCWASYIGGVNRNEAIFELVHENDEPESEFIYYRARLARLDGKPIETETTGIISMKEYLEKGLPTWWMCGECEAEDCFEYENEDEYKCKKCGYIGEIPYEL
jgi:hypothetical protein